MMSGACIEEKRPVQKNRYAAAARKPDWTIAQDWPSYTAEEHGRWNRLFARQSGLLPGRACKEALEAISALSRRNGHPRFCGAERAAAILTGWRVVAVAGLIPDDAFFEHLANRRFPAGAFIRPEHELDYLEEPDIFHDVFGHVPLLANPVYAAFLEAYGKGGRARSNAASCTISRAFIGTRSNSASFARRKACAFSEPGITSSPARRSSRSKTAHPTALPSILSASCAQSTS